MGSFTHVALATGSVAFCEDRVFDPRTIDTLEPSVAAQAMAWIRVRDLSQQRGLRLMTADHFGDDGIDPHHSLLVACDWTLAARRLVAGGARPAALISFDSPVSAWRLYHQLAQVSARFPHTFLFEGARERVAPTTRFHPLYFPQPCPPPRPTGRAWSKRRFLVMLANNQVIPRWRDLARWFDRPREVSLTRGWAGLQYRPILRDRFVARLRAIEAFSRIDDFDLFGEGWDTRCAAVEPAQHAAARHAYRGPPGDLPALLAGYRFCLVFENTRFPGYVSEGLFACFFARCIPIYSGAPDVAQYVPPAAYVDARQFATHDDLGRFLRATTEADARRFLDAAHSFLASPAYERYCLDRFARDMADALVQVGEQQ
ncbi:MAG: glycosyltransferase family 10 domain-containing protein [Chloroflexota bacterium]